ncbi:MAG: phospholipase D family protein [Gordonia amarae]
MQDLGLGNERTVRMISGRVWDEITELLGGARQITAAVAYVGENAADQLPLRSGSSIIVDASAKAVAQGSTAPKTLLTWKDAGAVIYSLPGLHAKMIVCERKPTREHPEGETFLIVGSANVSANSARRLDECALLTDDLTTLRETYETMTAWKLRAGEPLSREDLVALADLYRTQAAEIPPGENSPEENSPEEKSTGEDPAGENPTAEDRADDTNGTADDSAGPVETADVEEVPVPDTTPAPRPRNLILTSVREDTPSEEAKYEAEVLARDNDLTVADTAAVLTPGREYLDYFWLDFDRVYYGDPFPEGATVVATFRNERGQLTKTCSVAPPMRILSTFRDHQAERTYYYGVVRHSGTDVTYTDLQEASGGAGRTVNLASEDPAKVFRPGAITAIIGLWGDLVFE